MSRARIAVLASGAGTNLGALIAASGDGRLAADIVLVASDRPGSRALERARSAGIDQLAIAPREHPDRLAFDEALFAAIDRVQPTLIVCAGYMRLIEAPLVARWLGRMINLHPSLLPAYRGLHTHARALADGAREHGASVHFVTPELDGGPVIARVIVPVEPGDTSSTLAARLAPHEHRLLVATTDLLARDRAALVDGRVVVDGVALATPLALPFDAETLIR